MKYITKLIVNEYHMKRIDWLGYEVNKRTDFSFHHIIKKENGGKETRENGAILSYNTSHPYLHLIESKDFDIYCYLNYILKEINVQGYIPTTSQLLKINMALNSFEREHCSDRTKKGKILIKREFIERKINIC